jgi:hypothetical protein
VWSAANTSIDTTTESTVDATASFIGSAGHTGTVFVAAYVSFKAGVCTFISPAIECSSVIFGFRLSCVL